METIVTKWFDDGPQPDFGTKLVNDRPQPGLGHQPLEPIKMLDVETAADALASVTESGRSLMADQPQIVRCLARISRDECKSLATCAQTLSNAKNAPVLLVRSLFVCLATSFDVAFNVAAVIASTTSFQELSPTHEFHDLWKACVDILLTVEQVAVVLPGFCADADYLNLNSDLVSLRSRFSAPMRNLHSALELVFDSATSYKNACSGRLRRDLKLYQWKAALGCMALLWLMFVLFSLHNEAELATAAEMLASVVGNLDAEVQKYVEKSQCCPIRSQSLQHQTCMSLLDPIALPDIIRARVPVSLRSRYDLLLNQKSVDSSSSFKTYATLLAICVLVSFIWRSWACTRKILEKLDLLECTWLPSLSYVKTRIDSLYVEVSSKGYH